MSKRLTFRASTLSIDIRHTEAHTKGPASNTKVQGGGDDCTGR